jgi:hypothetical protein
MQVLDLAGGAHLRARPSAYAALASRNGRPMTSPFSTDLQLEPPGRCKAAHESLICRA